MDMAPEAIAPFGGRVLVQFEWRYGGENVFLSGSFNSWDTLLPMLPEESRAGVFRTICGVTPGYHEYKFFVDGEWLHDEQQPHLTRDTGTVNTIYIATCSNSNPSQSPEIPVRTNMEVDNDSFRQTVCLSDGSVNRSITMIPKADVKLFRDRVSVFLATSSAYELLPQSGKVVALDVDLPVKQAFHILAEQGIPTAPLWDSSKGQFTGMLSALDFILILRELGTHGSNLTEEELDTHSISAWKVGKSFLHKQDGGYGRSMDGCLVHAGSHDTLKDIALRILQNEVSTVPILSSSEGISPPQLLHVASLSGILGCICRYFKHSLPNLPVLQNPISAIPLGTWVPSVCGPANRHLAMLRSNASLSTVLNLLIQAQISSVPIVDNNDCLLDIYCRSDITALAKDCVYSHINLNEMTVLQALQLEQDSCFHEARNQRYQMCLRSDSLYKVMQRLSKPGVRRLVVVEAGSKQVEGIVTLSDVFRFLLG